MFPTTKSFLRGSWSAPNPIRGKCSRTGRLCSIIPWVIGDFVWTSWDYLGETGIGNAIGNSANRYPWFDAWCGDIDICGFKKPQHYYRDVVWGDSKIALAVHAPIPDGQRERVSGWGWPDERQSWTWPGSEGKTLDVTVYSSCQSVRLELDGKVIATQPVNNKMVARFKVPYQPGELRAIGLINGKRVASASLRTAGEPAKIRLIADRSKIRADRNDLSYVTVEIVDRHGTVVPDCDSRSFHRQWSRGACRHRQPGAERRLQLPSAGSQDL